MEPYAHDFMSLLALSRKQFHTAEPIRTKEVGVIEN